MPYTFNPLSGDLDYYSEIAKYCPNGDTFPTSPQIGQWFLHTPTGRKYLYQFDGSTWAPIISLQAATLYVDFALGTDTQANGFGTGVNAYKTIGFAASYIPPLYTGVHTINVAAGTYTSTTTLPSKVSTNNTAITIKGAYTTLDTVVPTSGVIGNGLTQGSITKTGAGWTPNAYANKLLFCQSGANANLYSVIDSNTTDTITIVGTFNSAPLATDTYLVYDWATILDVPAAISVNITNTLNAYTVQDISIKGNASNYSLSLGTNALQLQFSQCSIDAYGNGTVLLNNGAKARFDNTFVNAPANVYGVSAQNSSILTLVRDKIQGGAITGNRSGLAVTGGSICTFSRGCVIDGFNTGIQVTTNGVCVMSQAPTLGYPIIRNNTYGILTSTGGQLNSFTRTQNDVSNNLYPISEKLETFGYADGTGTMTATYPITTTKYMSASMTEAQSGIIGELQADTIGNGRNVDGVIHSTMSALAPVIKKPVDVWVDIN